MTLPSPVYSGLISEPSADTRLPVAGKSSLPSESTRKVPRAAGSKRTSPGAIWYVARKAAWLTRPAWSMDAQAIPPMSDGSRRLKGP